MFVLVCFFCLNEKYHLVLISFSFFFFNITTASTRNKSLRLATVGILKTSFHFYLGCRVRKSSLATEWSVFFLVFRLIVTMRSVIHRNISTYGYKRVGPSSKSPR